MTKEIHKEECTKCDERGMIQDKTVLPNWFAKSCPCGKHNQIMEKLFNEKFGNPLEQIDNLLAYGRQRIIDKQKYD